MRIHQQSKSRFPKSKTKTLTLNTTSSRKSNRDRRAQPLQPNNNSRSILLLQIRQRGTPIPPKIPLKKPPNIKPYALPNLALPLHRIAMHPIPRGCARATRAMELPRFHGLERAGGEIYPKSDTVAGAQPPGIVSLRCVAVWITRYYGKRKSHVFSYGVETLRFLPQS